jgi:hypothetical protein
MNNEDLQKLKNDIEEFDTYRNSLNENQVTYPLDKVSKEVISADLMIPTGNTILASNIVLGYESIQVNVNGKKYYLQTTVTY